MEKKQFELRLLAVGALFALVMIGYIMALFDAQIVHGEEYLARSIRANTRSETVETSRGVITDRNGKVLVTNRSVYTLELDSSLAADEDDALNADLTRLIGLLDRYGVEWDDGLPLSGDFPISYDFDTGGRRALYTYLISKKWADDSLSTDD